MSRDRQDRGTELRETLSLLQEGVAQLDEEQALALIARWRSRLAERSECDLEPIASDLEALRTLISGGSATPEAVGLLVARLGERVRAASRLVSQHDALVVARLGDLLFHAGHALRGPIPSNTPRPS